MNTSARRFLVIIGLLAAPPATNTAAAAEPCQEVRLAARDAPDLPPRRFCVPDAYTRWGVDGYASTDLHVTALWPSMAGAFARRDRPVPYDREFWGGNLGILFGPTASYPDIGFRFEAEKRGNRLTIPAEGAFGLDRLAADPAALSPGSDARDAYSTGSGEALVYGVCRRPEHVPAPGCRFEFVRGGLLIGVSFARALLPRWREITDATAALVAGFERRSEAAPPGAGRP